MELKAWIEQIDALSAGIESNVRYVMEDAIKESTREAQSKLRRFADDGNDDAEIVATVSGQRGNYTATVELVGADAEFVEYGYGAVAQGSYPEGDPWDYDINHHGGAGWYYAHGKKSYGMRAGAVIYYLTRDISDRLDNPDEIIARHRAGRRK